MGLWNMMKGGPGNTSQRLMRLRVAGQAIALILLLGALFFFGGVFSHAVRKGPRKDDVQEIEAVDTEVVDRMALRRDRRAVDLAGFCNNVGNFIECSGHACTS